MLSIAAADRINGESGILTVVLGFGFQEKLFALPLLYLLLLLETLTYSITNIIGSALLYYYTSPSINTTIS